MNYRTVVLHAEEDLGVTGTKTIDVNVKDPISALTFQTRITFVGGAARLIPEPDVFSKIELVDGSDVLMALSGSEIAALSFYEGNKQIDWAATNLIDETVEGYLRVNFGRFFRDPLLAFDPTKFRNPQLKFTYNAAAVLAAATHVYLRVIAECFDEKTPALIGFLQMKEFHSYLGAASAYEYIDLPTDLTLRKLYLQTKKFGSAHFQNLIGVKLDEDNDKRIPFDLLTHDWMDMQVQEFGRCHQNTYELCEGGNTPVWGAPCNLENSNLMNASADRNIWASIMTGGKFAHISSTTTDLGVGELSGALPYFVHCYPFGDQMDIDDWYDVTRVGALRFRIYSGITGASCTYNTILQQLRRY